MAADIEVASDKTRLHDLPAEPNPALAATTNGAGSPISAAGRPKRRFAGTKTGLKAFFLRTRIDSLCGRINGAYADMDWTPIRYVHRNYRRDELAGLYRAAKVCLVRPLRDGMNLVAKEYVAAQNPDNPGVLVLSRFAGAARQMTEAVIVNPFSHEEVSEGLTRALTMGLEERVGRWSLLMRGWPAPTSTSGAIHSWKLSQRRTNRSCRFLIFEPPPFPAT